MSHTVYIYRRSEKNKNKIAREPPGRSNQQYLTMVGTMLKAFFAITIFLLFALLLLRYVSKKMLKTLDIFAFLVENYHILSNNKDGFEEILSISSTNLSMSLDNNGCVRYKIPVSACLDRDRWCLGSIIALADVLTTFAIIANDANNRAGVSVSLTGKLNISSSVLLPVVNDNVTISISVDKVGASLGFAEVISNL